ncbi:hypothetical protein ABEB36_007002 [Hypothenemus hampei]|uniref:Uncharacterized protein n=1 Tax=Hypothenemus hampei TaxID=57062 RepID=A0ABD1EWE8_HYPHA
MLINSFGITFISLFLGVALCPIKNESSLTRIPPLIPKTTLEEIYQKHLESDEGFKAAILYFQGDEWNNLIKATINSPEYAKVNEMALKYHINLTEVINNINIQLKSLNVTQVNKEVKPNLGPFISDVQILIPITKITKMWANAKEKSNLTMIREKIGTKENQKLADDLYNLPEMKKMRDILKNMNFDVDPWIRLVYVFLGWDH